jgi:nitroreductase
MELSEAISGRRAVREYTAEPVDEQKIRSLIESAVQAPSAMNEQPWAFTVVRDQTLLDRASHQAKAHMLATTPASALPSQLRSMLEDENSQIFHHAPVLVLISAAMPGAFVVEDCTLAAQNLMLSAYAVGLGSCWIGFAASWLNTPEGRAVFGLPDVYEPVAPIILGHPKAAAPPTERKPPEIKWVG